MFCEALKRTSGIYDAVAVGPGIGVDAENTQIIRKILKEYKKTVVIDADGLNTVAAADLFEDMRTSSADIVITPHMGEAARLLDIMPAGREEIAEKLSELNRRNGCSQRRRYHSGICRREIIY